MNLQQIQPLACPSQRKAGIISINRLAGVDAVCLYALGNLDPAIEHGDVVKLGDFLNSYLVSTGSTGADIGSDLSDDLGSHAVAPVESLLYGFANYVREHQISNHELKMMIDVAIGAQVVICRGHNVELTGDGQPYRPASSDCKERR